MPGINRRGFFKTLAAAVAGAAVAPSLLLPAARAVTPIFTEPVVVGAVGEFYVAYITFTAEMWCRSPRQCGVITGIVAE